MWSTEEGKNKNKTIVVWRERWYAPVSIPLSLKTIGVLEHSPQALTHKPCCITSMGGLLIRLTAHMPLQGHVALLRHSAALWMCDFVCPAVVCVLVDFHSLFFFCHKTEQRKRANLTAILVHQFLLRFSENCNYEESSCTNHWAPRSNTLFLSFLNVQLSVMKLK